MGGLRENTYDNYPNTFSLGVSFAPWFEADATSVVMNFDPSLRMCRGIFFVRGFYQKAF